MSEMLKPGYVYTSRQVWKGTLPAGFWVVNIACLGAKPRWKVVHDPSRAVTCRTCGESNTTACGGCWFCGVPLNRSVNPDGLRNR